MTHSAVLARRPAILALAAFAVAQAGGQLDISGLVQDGLLVLALRVDDLPPETATEVEDRAGALDGRVNLKPGVDGAVHVRPELPCG